MAEARRDRHLVREPLPDAEPPHRPKSRRTKTEELSSHRLRTQCHGRIRDIVQMFPHVKRLYEDPRTWQLPADPYLYFSLYPLTTLENAAERLEILVEILERRMS
jgi:hypothetical protein